MERGKPFLSFRHPPCAYYSFVILFLMEYPVRAQGCHEAGVEISLATMYVALSYFHRKKLYKKNRTKRNPYLSDFSPTCCIYPATWNLGDSPWEAL